MEKNFETTRVVRGLLLFVSGILLCVPTAFAATGYSQSITLDPGWNVISTSRLLQSHTFSAPETLSNFAIYTLDPSHVSGWATMADLGQSEFMPLYGYFINNKSTTSQTLTLNYRASTTPNERLFERSFATSGWYAIGVANPTYADLQDEFSVDENNPSQVFNSIIGSTDLVVDFTQASFASDPRSVALKDPWGAALPADINLLNDVRETKAYAVYLKDAQAKYIGYQNLDQNNYPSTTADFSGSVLPVTGTADSQNNFVVWQRNLNVGSRNAKLSAIRFKETGTMAVSDIKNFRFMIDGVQVGAAVDHVDVNYFVNFVVASTAPLQMGPHQLKVVADIVGGASCNFKFSLAALGDVGIWDAALNTPVTPTFIGGGTFAVVDGGTISVNAGMLTVAKAADAPSGNITNSGSGVVFAKFDLKATGENMKVENLKANFISSDSNVTSLRNVGIFANGVQVGSTQTLLATGTQYNLGSSLVVVPGATTSVEIRGDVFDNDGTNDISIGDTVQISLLGGSSNVYKMSSLVYASSTAVSGNQLTVSGPSLTLAKYSAYANQTVTVPQTAYKIGEYRLTTGNTEGVNLDTITLGLTTSAAVTNLTDLYVVYNSKTSPSKSTGATSQTFSINEALAANSTMSFAVYANMNASMTGTVVSALAVSGTSQSSGQAVTSATITGQTMTIGSGVLTVNVDASTPVSALVVSNSMPKVGSFKFTGLNDTFTIDELTFQVLGGATGAAAIKNIVVKDGATTLATTPVNSSSKATSTGLTLAVPYNSNKIIDVYADLGTIGTGGAGSGVNVGVSLVSYEYLTSNGVKTRIFGSTSTNPFYAYKTKPTITNVALPSTVLTNGTQTVYKFTVTADAGGTVAWQYIKFNIASSSGITASSWALYDDANQSTPLTGVTLTPSAGTTVTASSSVDQEVSGSKTYVLKANIANVGTTGSFSVNISTGGAAHTAPTDAAAVVTAGSTSFVWSDESVVPHTSASADWNNENLVKNLPTDSQTLTK